MNWILFWYIFGLKNSFIFAGPTAQEIKTFCFIKRIQYKLNTFLILYCYVIYTVFDYCFIFFYVLFQYIAQHNIIFMIK